MHNACVMVIAQLSVDCLELSITIQWEILTETIFLQMFEISVRTKFCNFYFCKFAALVAIPLIYSRLLQMSISAPLPPQKRWSMVTTSTNMSGMLKSERKYGCSAITRVLRTFCVQNNYFREQKFCGHR